MLYAGAVSSYQYFYWVWDGDDIRMYHPSGSLIATRAVPKCDGTLVVVGVAFFNGISLGVWGVNDAGKFGFSAPGLGGCFDGPVSPTPVSPSTWGLIKSTHKESDK